MNHIVTGQGNSKKILTYEKKPIWGLTFIPFEDRLIGKTGKEKLIGMAILNIKEFPDDLHRKAKSEAALMGISLKELVIRALTEYLKKKKGRLFKWHA